MRVNVALLLVLLNPGAIASSEPLETSRQSSSVKTRPGVPTGDIDFSLSVDRWWSQHRFNPTSTNCAPHITSSQPAVDIRDFDGDIQKAIEHIITAEGAKNRPDKGVPDGYVWTKYLIGRFEITGNRTEKMVQPLGELPRDSEILGPHTIHNNSPDAPGAKRDAPEAVVPGRWKPNLQDAQSTRFVPGVIWCRADSHSLRGLQHVEGTNAIRRDCTCVLYRVVGRRRGEACPHFSGQHGPATRRTRPSLGVG